MCVLTSLGKEKPHHRNLHVHRYHDRLQSRFLLPEHVPMSPSRSFLEETPGSGRDKQMHGSIISWESAVGLLGY